MKTALLVVLTEHCLAPLNQSAPTAPPLPRSPPGSKPTAKQWAWLQVGPRLVDKFDYHRQ